MMQVTKYAFIMVQGKIIYVDFEKSAHFTLGK